MKKRLLCFLLLLATLLSVFPMAVSAQTDTEADTPSYHYTSLYVTDGLTMLLDAMDSSSANTTVDTAAGKWYSSVVNTDKYATLDNGSLTGAYAWSSRKIGETYKGIGYYQNADMAAASRGWWAANANTPGLDLGDANLPTESYTVEMVLNPYGIMNDTFTERVSTPDNVGLFQGFSFGPLKCWSFPAVRPATNETYDKRWYYTNGNGQSGVSVGNETVFNLAYADGSSNLTSVGKVISYGITHSLDKKDSVDTTLWQPTYTFYYGTTAKLTKTLSAGSYIPVSGASSSYGKFWIMYNWPCTVYSVRVYDKVLSASERAQNYMADILGYYDVDVSLFATVDTASEAAAKAALSGAFASFTFADTTDLAAYNEAKAEAEEAFALAITPYAGSKDEYSDLYVQDGLTVLLSAFGAVNASVRFDEEDTYAQKIDKKTYTYAKWYNKVDGSFVKLIGGKSVWSFTGHNGITYQQSAGSYNSGIDLGIENLPTGSYTVETFLTPIGLTDALGNRVKQNGAYGPNYESGTVLGPLKTLSFPTEHTDGGKGWSANYSDNGQRWYYSGGVYNYSTSLNTLGASWFTYKGSDASYKGQYLFQIDSEYTMKTTSPRSWVITHTLSGNATDGYKSTYINYADMTQRMKLSAPISNATYGISYIPVDDTMEFAIMRAFPCTVYTIRVYDRVLSSSELLRNRFVDLAAYYALDLSVLRALPEATRDAALAALGSATADRIPAPYAKATYKAEKEDLQKEVDAILDGYAYVGLYNQDNLKGIFLSYSAIDSADLTTGTWINLVNTDKNASIQGAWQNGENGGIYYNIAAINSDYYLDLGIDLLPTGDYTVEQVAKVTGFTQNADGVTQLPSTSEYGVSYNTQAGFNYGPLKGFVFGAASSHATPVLHLNRMRWMYAEAGVNSWSAIGAKYGWGTTDSSAYYNDFTVHDVIIAHDYTPATDSASAKAVYTLYKNRSGYATLTYPSGSNTAYLPVTSNMSFYLFRSTGTHAFAIRVYADLLSTAERRLNHAVDILAYYGADVSSLATAEADIRSEALGLLGTALDACTFAEGSAYETVKGEVLLKYVRVLQTCGIEVEYADRVTPFYTSLYVQSGLVALLDAMDKNEETSTVSLTDGRWYSSLGNTAYYAELTGKEYWKKGTDGKGVGFSLTYDNRSTAVGLNLGIEALPAASYTLEYIASFAGLTDANGNRYVDSTSTYGYNFENAFVAGPLKQLSFPCARLSGKDGNMEQRWFYVKTGGWAAVSYVAKFKTSHLKDSAADQIFSEAITHSLSASNAATYSFYSNTKTIGSFAIASDAYVAHNATTENLFRLFYQYPATVYSVRIYDRVLNEAERKQNHFADLIAYFGFDVASFWNTLSAEEKTALYEAAWQYDFSVSSDTVWSLISRYAMTDELYVTDGLVFLLNAYSANSSELDLAEGKWYNKYSDDYATLIGGNTHWNKLANGVGYGLVFDTQDASVGLSLPASLLKSDSYTVEIAADILGLREDNGGKTGNDSTFNHSVDYTMAFGPLKAKQWNSPVDAVSMAYPTKWYYAAGASNKLDAASETFELDTKLFSPEAEGDRTLAVIKTTADTTESYSFYGNFSLLGSVSAAKASAEDDVFTLFYQMPATVYAIRVYNRALSEVEQLQNHFADIAYYYALDISAFKTYENKSEVYEGMKDLGFDLERSEAQAILNFLLGDNEAILSAALEYDGLSARLSGANSGIRSVYLVNHTLIKALERKYNVAYGAITGIGEYNGTAVNATRDLAVSGSFESGFAASSRNSACVVVYGTDGASYATGLYLPDGKSFAYTSILSDASETQAYYENVGMVYAGFLSLTDKETGEALAPVYYYAEGSRFGTDSSTYGRSTSIKEVAYHFVEVYEGTNANMYKYNSNERLRNILYACGYTDEDLRVVPDEATILENLKADLKAKMAENTKDLAVLVAGTLNGKTATDLNGKSYTLGDGEKAIWLEYAPDLDPASYSNVDAVYFWYPMATDPLSYTLEDGSLDADALKAMGALRVFAYMSVPENTSKGLVCVHGGGGHAYSAYTVTAANHGYAAIAFDTEGWHADGTGGSANVADPLGHKSKDSFRTAKEAIENQWMYYAISDCAFANTILQSLDGVDADKVGITGISWGGLTTTIASCYDARFDFAVPVYLSYYLGYGENTAQFVSIADPFAADLWQDVAMLEASRVPTLILNSQKDLWADVKSSVRTYNSLKKNNEHAYLVIKPDLGHSQQAGAPPAEIYRFGDWVTSGFGAEKSCYAVSSEITNKLGTSYTVDLTVAKDLASPTATLYYTTEAITYGSGGVVDQAFHAKEVTLTAAGTDANGNAVYSMTVSVPDNAYLYYISYKASSSYDAGISSPYDYAQSAYKGYIYGSSSIVVLDGGDING